MTALSWGRVIPARMSLQCSYLEARDLDRAKTLRIWIARISTCPQRLVGRIVRSLPLFLQGLKRRESKGAKARDYEVAG